MLCRIRAYGYQGGESTGDKWRKHSLGYFLLLKQKEIKKLASFQDDL